MLVDLEKGVGYIVNYFAVLGVSKDATDEAITKAKNNKIRLYHPDRFEGVAEEFRKQAESKSRIILEAYAVLHDPETRAAYDMQLENWHGPISEDGTPIAKFVHSPEEAEELIKSNQERSGYNPVIHEVLKAQFYATDTPSVELENAYSHSLARLDRHLSMAEQFYGDASGVSYPLEVLPPVGYLEYRTGQIEEGRERLQQELPGRFTSLSSGEVQALSAGILGSTTPSEEDQASAIAVYSERLLEQYTQASGKMLALAQKREEVINERLKLFKGTYHPPQTKYYPSVIVFINGEIWLAFRLDSDTLSIEIDPTISTDEMSILTDDAAAQRVIESERNIIHIPIQEGIPLQDALNIVLNKHFELLENQQRAEQ